MKIIDIIGSLRLPISNEENQLLEKIVKSNGIYKESLNERERELSRQLVSKGVLKRVKNENKTFYLYNEIE